MRRLHLIDGDPTPHNTYDDDPDAIPECPCDPVICERPGLVVIKHRPL